MVVDATVLGVPVNVPFAALKLIPGGVALIAKLAIAPPVELAVNPVAAVFTVRDSDDDVNVNAGGSKKVPDVLTEFTVPFQLTATNKPFAYVTEFHPLFTTDERLVQVIPSGLVITLLAVVPSVLTATNKPLP